MIMNERTGQVFVETQRHIYFFSTYTSDLSHTYSYRRLSQVQDKACKFTIYSVPSVADFVHSNGVRGTQTLVSHTLSSE